MWHVGVTHSAILYNRIEHFWLSHMCGFIGLLWHYALFWASLLRDFPQRFTKPLRAFCGDNRNISLLTISNVTRPLP